MATCHEPDNDPTNEDFPRKVQPSSHPVQSLPVGAGEHRRDRRLPSFSKRRLRQEDRVWRWTRSPHQRGGHRLPSSLSVHAFLASQADCNSRSKADQSQGSSASKVSRRWLPTFLRGSSACKTEGASSCQRQSRSQLASAKAAKGSDGEAAECG